MNGIYSDSAINDKINRTDCSTMIAGVICHIRACKYLSSSMSHRDNAFTCESGFTTELSFSYEKIFHC